MPEKQSLIGQRFGRLKVIAEAQKDKHGNRSSMCACDCGKTITLPNPYLKTGDTKSCGCLRRDLTRANHLTHGKSRSKTWLVWTHIKARCYNRNDPSFKRYGGRGITVCDRWMEFENFLEDMGERPDGLTIERRDNNLGYFRENCKWASRKEQARNTRRNRIVTVRGITGCLSELCERFGVDADLVWNRHVKGGWDIERALFQPIRR